MTTAQRSLMSHQERRRIARELHDGGPSASPFRLPLPFLPCRANLRFRATAQERRSPLSDSPGGKATSISAVPEPEPGVRLLLVCGVLVVALFVARQRSFDRSDLGLDTANQVRVDRGINAGATNSHIDAASTFR